MLLQRADGGAVPYAHNEPVFTPPPPPPPKPKHEESKPKSDFQGGGSSSRFGTEEKKTPADHLKDTASADKKFNDAAKEIIDVKHDGESISNAAGHMSARGDMGTNGMSAGIEVHSSIQNFKDGKGWDAAFDLGAGVSSTVETVGNGLKVGSEEFGHRGLDGSGEGLSGKGETLAKNANIAHGLIEGTNHARKGETLDAISSYGGAAEGISGKAIDSAKKIADKVPDGKVAKGLAKVGGEQVAKKGLGAIGAAASAPKDIKDTIDAFHGDDNGKKAGGILNLVSDGTGIAAGVCACTGVGAPVAAGLGAVSAITGAIGGFLS